MNACLSGADGTVGRRLTIQAGWIVSRRLETRAVAMKIWEVLCVCLNDSECFMIESQK